VSPSVGSF
jgi:hypothetical protein